MVSPPKIGILVNKTLTAHHIKACLVSKEAENFPGMICVAKEKCFNFRWSGEITWENCKKFITAKFR